MRSRPTVSDLSGSVSLVLDCESHALSRRAALTSLAANLAVALLPPLARAADAVPLIAAAADLKLALPALIAAFKSKGGRDLSVTFGSSGMLAHQIELGAPFELFFSADEAYVRQLFEKGLTRDEGKVYALGYLALFAGPGSPVTVDSELKGLKEALMSGALKHLAIANPEHAPYGRAARAALEKSGLLEAATPRFVLGENVAQALQFALQGGAEAALVPVSLVGAKRASIEGRFAQISTELTAPLRQRAVLLKSASEPLAAFYDFVNSPEARQMLGEFGFSAPLDP